MISSNVACIDRAGQLLQQACHALAFTGAGISTASGIPDFRSPDSGLWSHLDPLKVASIHGFRQNPERFYQWIYPLAQMIYDSQPNAAHIALAQMEAAGLLQGVITQNIDTLHTQAGTQKLYELHGDLHEATCIRCFTRYRTNLVLRKFLEDALVPRCSQCGGVLKPNIILFGEQLPAQTLLAAKHSIRQADLLIVIGSSLAVAPASDLPRLAVQNGAKLIIVNLEPTHLDPLADIVIHADAAVVIPQLLRSVEVRV